jgi:hypothetical protein
MPNVPFSVSSWTRPWLESAVASMSAVLGIVTIFWPDWIEAVTGADPDRHGGAVEWAVVVMLAVLAGVSAVAARRDFRRLSRT